MGQLVDQAIVIRDETTPAANTATRVGDLLYDMAVDIESGQPNAAREFRASFRIDSNSIENLTVIKSTINGTATISFDGSVISVVCNGAFPVAKTDALITPNLNADGTYIRTCLNDITLNDVSFSLEEAPTGASSLICIVITVQP